MEPIKPDLTGNPPPVQAPVEAPKNKEGWDKLRKENPDQWGALTQERMDTIFRENKESKERLAAVEQRERNLLLEIDKFKQVPPPPIVTPGTPKTFGNGVYPENDTEWNDLFLENPIFANDLRNEFHNKKEKVKTDWEVSRNNAAGVVQKEHPDMYILELDDQGSPKKDDKGKPVLKIDPVTGFKILNPATEKGKLWTEIYNEDPAGWNSLKTAPLLLMAEMERRLRVKGAAMVNGQNDKEAIDQSGVIPQGVTPPQSIPLKFDSDEEKAHAQGMVNRGLYKSLDEYVQYHTKNGQGYVEKNSRPDFTRK